ncbi:MAG: hypothetical protein ACL93V_15825 [Candidatus Electrothrix sp. YB6]
MKKTCFVIIPFGGNFDSYYKMIICPGIEASGLTPVRADEIYGTKPIIEDICDQIFSAKIIIADVSTKNPNVNYELGVAHALNKQVIIISQSIDDVPFDYKHRRVIIYDTTQVDWSSDLRNSIVNTISSTVYDNSNIFSFQSDDLYKRMSSFLTKMQMRHAYEISKDREIYSDKSGNCTLKESWQIKAKTILSHVSCQIYIDKPGEIEILNIRDVLNAIDLNYFVRDQKSNHLDFFILFDHPLELDEIINLSLEIKADNYLSDVVEKNKGFVFQVSMKTGNSVIGKNKETYFFPDIPKFKNLHAVVKNHPDKNMIGTVINSIVKKDMRVIYLDLSHNTNYFGDFSAELQI